MERVPSSQLIQSDFSNETSVSDQEPLIYPRWSQDWYETKCKSSCIPSHLITSRSCDQCKDFKPADYRFIAIVITYAFSLITTTALISNLECEHSNEDCDNASVVAALTLFLAVLIWIPILTFTTSIILWLYLPKKPPFNPSEELLEL